MRRSWIFASLMLAVALFAAAHTFEFSVGSQPACLAIGKTTYRLVRGDADLTVRIDASAAVPGLRIRLAALPEEADFALVDDGAPPECRTAASTRDVGIMPDGAADLVIGLADESTPADYRIYVRSRWITPETAAALFAAAHMPPRRVAGVPDRSD